MLAKYKMPVGIDDFKELRQGMKLSVIIIL